VVLEKAPVWGGTSALSGGILWIPLNHLMAKDGFTDSEEATLTYLDAVIGDGEPASTPARRRTYVRNAARMVASLEEEGFAWSYRNSYWDYLPDKPGAHDCRGVGIGLFDAHRLDDLYASLRPSDFPALAVYPAELDGLIAPLRSFANLSAAMRVAARTLSWRMHGRIPLSGGQSLVGQLMVIARRHGVQLRLGTRLTDLILDDDRVVGVDTRIGERSRRFEARSGVVLCAGGFARNDEFRRRFQACGADYTLANPGDLGDGVRAGMAAGAATELMDDAWWTQTVRLPDGTNRLVLWERVLPHSIIVDQLGQRYLNEAQSYDTLGRIMLAHNRTAASIPSWLIMDARHRRRYPFGSWPGGYTPRSMIRQGFFVKARSVEELARGCSIDVPALSRTLERFNTLARSGVDVDFGRGDDKFDHTYADRTVSPNPCLGTVDRAPFWAVRLYPGDFGTKGGLLTDEHGRVLRDSRRPITGLYAAGNTTASFTGHSYPGPGTTLGSAAVFGYLAGEHVAQQAASPDPA
jgi:3-oxosteroid 1-dehydrogenase